MWALIGRYVGRDIVRELFGSEDEARLAMYQRARWEPWISWRIEPGTEAERLMAFARALNHGAREAGR